MRPGIHLTRSLVFFDRLGIDGAIGGLVSPGGRLLRTASPRPERLRPFVCPDDAPGRRRDPRCRLGGAVMSSFPWLTTIGLIPLVGALVVALLPVQRRRQGQAPRARLLGGHAAVHHRRRAAVQDRVQRPVPARGAARLDPAVRGQLRPRRRRDRAGPHRDVRDHRAGVPPRGLARRARGRPAPAELLRADAGARDVHGRRVRRHRRVPVLRPLRGDAHPGLLPHRLVRRPAPPVRRGEVPALQPHRWPGHAGRGHRALRAGPGRPAGVPVLQPARAQHGPDHRAAAVPRLLLRVRRQGAAVAAAHLAARRRDRGPPGHRRPAHRACSTRSAPSA